MKRKCIIKLNKSTDSKVEYSSLCTNKKSFQAKSTLGFHSLAFTLAEVLITLAIIGVVAAMTIPTLMKNSETVERVSTLKEMFSTLTQASSSAINDNGTPDQWNLIAQDSLEGATNVLKMISPYIKITKICAAEDKSCTPNEIYKAENGAEYNYLSGNNSIAALLNNGTIIAVQIWETNCEWDWGGANANLKNVCAQLTVDVNGFKKPNTFGKDTFLFLLTKKGIYPNGLPDQTGGLSFTNSCADNTLGYIAGTGANGMGCTAWVLYNGNMDYLKCTGLDWSTKTKCN